MSTAETSYYNDPNHLHVPQAKHVGCRLEILKRILTRQLKNPASLNMQPQGVSTIKYWQMTLWWIYNGKV